MVRITCVTGITSGLVQTGVCCAKEKNGVDVNVNVNVNVNGGINVSEKHSGGIMRYIFNGWTHTPVFYGLLRTIGAHKGMDKLFEPDEDGCYSGWQIAFTLFALWRGFEVCRSVYRLATRTCELGGTDEVIDIACDFSIPFWIIKKIINNYDGKDGYKARSKLSIEKSWFSENYKG